MAIYHLTAKTGSKAKGQSAGAKFDYISREGKYSKDCDELVHRQNGNLPEWASDDPAAYWRAADLHERSNGRLFKELEFALPRELARAEQIKLAEQFAQSLAKTERLPYTLAVHAGKGENPHVHLMISERRNDGMSRTSEQWFRRYNGKQPEKGGARKTEALKPKEWLESTREAWAKQANKALRKAGHRKTKIDHRSLEAQGVDREPTTHLGPSVVEMEQRGIRTWKAQDAIDKEREINVSTRQNQIREIERGTGRRTGADRRQFALGGGRGRAQDGAARGAFKRLWSAVGPNRGPEGLGAIQRTQRANLWLSSRLSRFGVRGYSGSAVISQLGEYVRGLVRQRQAEQARAAADRERRREVERVRADLARAQSQSKGRSRGNNGISVRRGRDRDGGMSR